MILDDQARQSKPGAWGQGSVSVGHEGLLVPEAVELNSSTSQPEALTSQLFTAVSPKQRPWTSQLGREGWKLYGHERKYWPFRAVDYHTLGIADAYIELLQREQSGTIEILGYQTEPESWRTIGGADLRPDLFVDIGLPHKGERVKLWLEIDMGTERQSKIKEKLASYWHAYKNSTQEELPTFPRVVFLAPDDMRARELRYIIEHGPKDAQKLFLVSTVAQYGALLFG